MRCPKCHYLSFEPEARCRNCGYDLTFEPGDLIVETTDPTHEPAAELDLRLAAWDEPATPNRPFSAARSERSSADSVGVGSELPLFVRGVPGPVDEYAGELRRVDAQDAGRSGAGAHSLTMAPAGEGGTADAALPGDRTAEGKAAVAEAIESGTARSLTELEAPALPRAPRPLSVRRPTPAPGRVREKYHQAASGSRRQIGLLERDLLEGLEEAAPPAPEASRKAERSEGAGGEIASAPPVGAGRRVEAAGVDALLLGAINAAIVWLTLRLCNLGLAEVGLLPVAPLAALFFLLDGLYLLMFTAANGQTIGKMAAGIRVVAGAGETDGDRISVKQAVLRAVWTFPSALVFGAGFLPALFGSGLAWHDRVARTRVVRT